MSPGSKGGQSEPRSSVRPPHVAASLTRTARSSSPSPCSRLTSRWRRLRSSSPSVASLRLAARWSERASAAKALKSSPPISIWAIRANAAGGSPFSTTSSTGRIVAGSIASRQTPSNGTARARIRAASEREVMQAGATVDEPREVVAEAFG